MSASGSNPNPSTGGWALLDHLMEAKVRELQDVYVKVMKDKYNPQPPKPTPEEEAGTARSPRTPFPVEATRRILECPHILENIVAHSPRYTQAAFVRTSRQLYNIAGRVLYHTVRIDSRNMSRFFRGALNRGEHEKEAEEGLGKCGYSEGQAACKVKTAKEEGKGASSSDPSPSATGPPPSSPAKAETPGAASKTAGKKRKSKNKKGNKKGSKIQSVHAPKPEPKLQDTLVPSPCEAEGDSEPICPNFKAHLLKYVRVLTIGTHHSCICAVYGPHFSTLMPNMDIVRTASDFDQPFSLIPICDCDDDDCDLLKNIRTRKLVLRNLDGQGLPLAALNDTYPACEELVVFLPLDARAHSMNYVAPGRYPLLMELGHCFPSAPNTKIVFYPNWEKGVNDVILLHYSQQAATPDEIVYNVSSFLEYAVPKYTIYGMGKLRWAADGDLVAVYRHHFPNVELTQRALLDLVRTELRTGSLFCDIGRFDGEFEYDPGYPENVTYKTFTEYIKDEKGRRGEINADD